MGDRNSIVIQEDCYGHVDANPLTLYSHWHGQHLDQVLIDALTAAGHRRQDPAYFTAIIMRHMLKDDINGTTGFGISQMEQDHDAYNHKLYVSWVESKATSIKESIWEQDNRDPLRIKRNDVTYTASEFIQQFDKVSAT